MNSTVLRSFVILSLWSSLSTPPRITAPDAAQAAGTKSAGTRLDIDLNDLFQHWVHSREEEPPGETVQIFRPSASRKFPPSRFRMQFIFTKDGTCKWMFLSPEDAHRFKDGQWKIDPADARVLQIIKGAAAESSVVIELTKDLLKLKPLPSASQSS